MSDEDENDVMGEYEARLIGACERGNIRMNNLFDFIIAGEKLKLDKLVSSAVTLASKCKSKLLKQHMRYNEISEFTKNKITERRMTLLEEKGTKCDVFLDRLFLSFHFKHIANIACHSLLSITFDVYKLINFI